MNQSQPKTIFLKDYRPHPFSIESVNLIVDIDDDFTTVQSHLRVKKEMKILEKNSI